MASLEASSKYPCNALCWKGRVAPKSYLVIPCHDGSIVESKTNLASNPKSSTSSSPWTSSVRAHKTLPRRNAPAQSTMSEQQGAEKRPREPEADGATAAPAAPAEEEREEKKSRASPSPSAPDPSVKTQLKVAVSSDQGTKQYMEDISVVMHDARKEGAASSRCA